MKLWECIELTLNWCDVIFSTSVSDLKPEVCQNERHLSQRGRNSQDCFYTLMVEFPGERKPYHMAGCYLKRYTYPKINPKEGVLTCSAQKLEPLALEQALKDILNPKYGLEMTSIIADGDSRTKKVMETCVWELEDVEKRGLDEYYIGKNVIDYEFAKIECWSHLKKNIPIKLEGIFKDGEFLNFQIFIFLQILPFLIFHQRNFHQVQSTFELILLDHFCF